MSSASLGLRLIAALRSIAICQEALLFEALLFVCSGALRRHSRLIHPLCSFTGAD